MTPKEKAEELFDKILRALYPIDYSVAEKTAKKFAIIAIEEIIKSNPTEKNTSNYSTVDFWKEVLTEIEYL